MCDGCDGCPEPVTDLSQPVTNGSTRIRVCVPVTDVPDPRSAAAGGHDLAPVAEHGDGPVRGRDGHRVARSEIVHVGIGTAVQQRAAPDGRAEIRRDALVGLSQRLL